MGAERRTGLDLVAAVTAFLVPVGYFPLVDAPFWSPKAAVVLPAAAIGLSQVPALLRTPLRMATLAAVAFLGAATLSTALADDVRQAVFGLYNLGTGLVFIAALVGCWALGASVTVTGRRTVVLGLVAGTGASAAVGVLQVVVDLGVPFLGSPEGGRATGLAGNPVHLAALALGVVAIAAAKVQERAWWLLAVGAGAAVIQLSGTRFALLLLPLLLLALAVCRGMRPAALVLAALLLGLGAGEAASSLSGQGTSTSGRVAAMSAAGGGATARVESWLSARHAVGDDPVLGVGPGRFRAATSPHRTLALARAEGPDRLFEDAHNMAVEYVVTTGVLGAGALGAWLMLGTAAARTGALAGFSMAVLGLHLVQPQSVGTTTLALLALGAAAASDTPAEKVRHPLPGLVPVAACAFALLVGGTLLAGDAQLQRARLDFDDDASLLASSLLAPWPNPATVRARIFLFRALEHGDRSAVEQALRWRREAVGRARDSPREWTQLADDEREAGQTAAALAHYEEALRRNPWSRRALRGITLVGNRQQARAAADRLGALVGP